MDQEFCKQIDEEDLIEKYIAGKLHGELLNRLTEHLSECQKHSEAVNLEKILSRGVRDFARTELKDKLNFQVQKNEISKYYILRYAAILFVAILAPIVLYYQFVKTTPSMETIAENKTPASSMEAEAIPPSEGITVKPTSEPQVTANSARKKPVMDAPAMLSTQKPAALSANMKISGKTLSMQPADAELYPEIFNILESNEKQIINCISESERGDHNQIILKFTLSDKGQIDGIEVSPDLLHSTKTADCISEILNQLEFPAPKKKTKLSKPIDLN